MSSPKHHSTYRPILPAEGDERNPSSSSHKKRKITTVACASCQRKRCKCDGARPRCSNCVARGATSPCVYDTRSGQSRTEALREANMELQAENLRLQALLDASTDESAPLASPNPMASSPSVQSGAISSAGSPSHPETSRASSEASERPTQGQSRARRTPRGTRGMARSDSPSPSLDQSSLLQARITQLESECGALRAAVEKLQSQASSPSVSMGFRPAGRNVGSDWSQSRPAGGSTLDRSPEATSSQSEYMQQDIVDDSSRTQSRRLNPSDDTSAFDGNLAEASRRIPLRNERRFIHKPQNYGGFFEIFKNLPLSSAILANYHPDSVQLHQVDNLGLPIHLIQMLNWEDHATSPVNVLSPEFASSTFHSFRNYSRHLIANGANPEHVLGPVEIDVQQFFRAGQELQVHTTGTFAPWFLGTYPSMSVAVKVACAIVMQGLLRWQIYPTAENFESMPEWMRPNGAQMFIPHISAFDFIPWPKIRNLLIDNGRLPERQTLALIISNLAIEWTRSTEDIFVWNQSTGLAVGVSDAFVAHVRNLDNWAINEKLLALHPELVGTARFVDLDTELELRATDVTERFEMGLS